MKYANGDMYCGEFADGAKQGAGILTLAATKGEEAKLEGSQSKKEGGREEEEKTLEEHGGEYCGDFENDQMHGDGTFNFPDGSVYVGQFKDGFQHGDGMLTLDDGTELIGKWEMGDQVSADYNIELGEAGNGEGQGSD